VVIFASHYLPGYRAGGPIKSIANAVEALLEEFEVVVATRDRDLGDRQPFEVAKQQQPASYGGVAVHYFSPGPLCVIRLRRFLWRQRPDLIYLNSFFDPMVTTLPLLLHRLGWLPPGVGIALAPRGEFSPGAMALKPLRKRLFLRLAKALDLYRHVIWQATADKEVHEIQTAIAPNAPVILVIPDPPALARVGGGQLFSPKPPGRLRLVFLARISRMKNLDGALRILMGVKERVELSIYGPTEDADYWALCRRLIQALPDNVTARYLGAVRPDQVAGILQAHDLLFLPTLGENFGHVICEAWASSCPVLISDNTPWRNLEGQGVGWDVPLDNPERFQELIDRCARMDSTAYEPLKHRARAHAEELYRTSSAHSSLRTLFFRALLFSDDRTGIPA
jgi:glycosyltransferase involved in cell wall biosynthesis